MANQQNERTISQHNCVNSVHSGVQWKNKTTNKNRNPCTFFLIDETSWNHIKKKQKKQKTKSWKIQDIRFYCNGILVGYVIANNGYDLCEVLINVNENENEFESENVNCDFDFYDYSDLCNGPLCPTRVPTAL